MLIAQIEVEVFSILDSPNYLNGEIAYKQSDYDLKQIAVKLKSMGKSFTVPENSKILWNCERPDGKTASFEVDVSKSEDEEGQDTIYCTLGTWHTQYVGTIYSEISIITDNAKLTSQTFSITIPKAIISDEETKQDSNYPILVKLVKNVRELIDDIKARLENGEFNGASVTITNIEQTQVAGGVSTVSFSDGNQLQVRNGYDGLNAKSPYINPDNKHWMIWDVEGQEYTDTGIIAEGVGSSAQNCVRYDAPQELNESQKKQARENIAAISLDEAEPAALTNKDIDDIWTTIMN